VCILLLPTTVPLWSGPDAMTKFRNETTYGEHVAQNLSSPEDTLVDQFGVFCAVVAPTVIIDFGAAYYESCGIWPSCEPCAAPLNPHAPAVADGAYRSPMPCPTGNTTYCIKMSVLPPWTTAEVLRDAMDPRVWPELLQVLNVTTKANPVRFFLEGIRNRVMQPDQHFGKLAAAGYTYVTLQARLHQLAGGVDIWPGAWGSGGRGSLIQNCWAASSEMWSEQLRAFNLYEPKQPTCNRPGCGGCAKQHPQLALCKCFQAHAYGHAQQISAAFARPSPLPRQVGQKQVFHRALDADGAGEELLRDCGPRCDACLAMWHRAAPKRRPACMHPAAVQRAVCLAGCCS
jgi:hypothetical protein